MIVEFWTDNYAPGMVQVQIKNVRTRRAVVKAAQANGRPLGDEDTVLLSHEDAAELLGAKYQDVEEGFTVCVRVDDFTARGFYGYC